MVEGNLTTHRTFQSPVKRDAGRAPIATEMCSALFDRPAALSLRPAEEGEVLPVVWLTEASAALLVI